MAISFDGATKVITLSSGTTTLGVRDLWSRWVDWWLTGDNSKHPLAMSNVGGDDIDTVAGTKIPIYCFLLNGWKVKPQEANHTLKVDDGILLVSGGGDPFMNTSGSYVVRINYQQPVQAISFDSGGGSGGLTAGQAAQLLDLWQRHGLDIDNPLTQTTTSIAAGGVDLAITGDPDVSVTVTRQP